MKEKELIIRVIAGMIIGYVATIELIWALI